MQNLKFFDELIKQMQVLLTESFVKFFNAIIIFLVCTFIYNIIKKAISKILNKSSLEQSVINFIISIVNIMGVVLIALIVMSALNFPIAAMTTVVTTFGIGISLAFKDGIGNIGSGVVLLLSRQFKIGDYISSNGVEGIVHDMSVFTTSLKTKDNKVIMIPNSILIKNTILNYTNQDIRRIDISLTVPHDTNIYKLKETLTSVLDAEKRILENPEYVIIVKEFNNKGISVLITPWVCTSDYWSVYYDLVDKMLVKLKYSEIPLTQTSVTLLNNVTISKSKL